MTEVVTGEAVVLDVPCAQFPSRLVSLLIDMFIQIVLLVVLATVILVSSKSLDAAEVAGILVGTGVIILVGYPTTFETLTRGRTPGKVAAGLRVVSDDGGPVRFRQALVRALTGAIEIWSIVGAPIGLILSMVSAKGKRLGDMFAGTYVIQERVPPRPSLPPAFATVPPPLLGWAQVAEMSRLSDQNAEAASSYLRRLYELRPAARDELGLRIAAAVASQVSPPPPPDTPPWAYLAAVLAIRRDREFARLAAPQPAPPVAPGAGSWPPSGSPPPFSPSGAPPAPSAPAPSAPAPSGSAPSPPAPSASAPYASPTAACPANATTPFAPATPPVPATQAGQAEQHEHASDQPNHGGFAPPA